MNNPKERIAMSSKELIVNIILIMSTVTLGVQVYSVNQADAPVLERLVK